MSARPQARQPLRTIALVSSKGGSGKTTLALHLAVAAELQGRKTLIADTDRQRSALEWRRARSSSAPEVAIVQPPMLKSLTSRVEQAGYQLMIIDTPPIAGQGVLQAIASAQLTLIITRPTMLDLWSVAYSADQVRAVGGRALFVLNQAPSARAGRESPMLEYALERLESYGFPVLEAGLRARVAFNQSVGVGKTAQETEPGSVAAVEITRLATAVFSRLWKEPSALS